MSPSSADVMPIAPIQARLPVLTGFLGSGKTTLLAALLRHPEFARTAVIVNEFGAIGLDHLLVETRPRGQCAREAGCLCCSCAATSSHCPRVACPARRDGAGVRPHRHRDHRSGRPGARPARIMVDASWRAHPARRRRHDDRCGQRRRYAGRHGGLGEQVAIADRLVLTKTDLASPQPALMPGSRRSTRRRPCWRPTWRGSMPGDVLRRPPLRSSHESVDIRCVARPDSTARIAHHRGHDGIDTYALAAPRDPCGP